MAIREEITLDLLKPMQYINIRLQQNDGFERKVDVLLTTNGSLYTVPSTSTVTLRMQKRDGSPIYNQCELINSNKVSFTVTPQMTSLSGRQPAQLQIIDNATGGILKTLRFHLLIDEEVITDSMIIDSGEFTALEDAMLRIGDLSLTEEVRELNEVKRIQAEQDRENRFETEKNALINQKSQEIDTQFSEKYDGLEQEYAQDLTTVKSQLQQIVTEKATKIEVDVERQRINQIVVNPGSTSGDLALNDIKVGADGVIYNSPGDATREQIRDLKEYLGSINNLSFQDDINLKSPGNYTLSTGWKLVGDGTRAADATSEIIGYLVTAGDLLHIRLTKHNDCVYYFATAYSFNSSVIVGDVVRGTVDKYVVVPAGATRLMISQALNDADNNYIRKTVFKNNRTSTKIDDVSTVLKNYDVITYHKGRNRFDVNKEYYLDNYYVLKGEYVPLTGHFVTHLMEVEENTTYYKREDADGIFYDKNCNIIGTTSSNPFITPNNCKYYRTSLQKTSATLYYVSTNNSLSSFSDKPQFTEEVTNAIKELIQNNEDIEIEIQSISSKYVNTTQSSKDAVITFIDDDGRAEVYTRLLPIITSKNIKYGLAIVSQYIDGASNCMTMEQLKECYGTGLIETLSHTYTLNSSLTTMTDDELDYQFSMSKKWLADNGFDNRGLVYPQNDTNKLVRTVARKYYDFAFRGTYFNDKGYLDHSTIDRVAFGSFTSTNPSIDGISGKNTLEYYKACVDKAIANGEWLIFMTHIADQTMADDEILEELIDYIQGLNVSILSPSEAFELKRNQVNIGDTDDKYLFVGNKNFSSNIIGYQYRLRSEIEGNAKVAVPVTKYPPNAVTITYLNAAADGGYPTTAGTLETFYCKTSPDFSWQRWTALPTCKIHMRFWDATNSTWFGWVAIN